MQEQGTVLNNRYRIETVLGEGGMGTVYLGRLLPAGSFVAIKAMHPIGGLPEVQQLALRQFRLEADILRDLDHPILPRVHDYFEIDNTPFLVMDYIKGRTLSQVVGEEDDLLPAAMVMRWAAQLCEVLQYLHSHDPVVVFRDVKPRNIMLDVNGGIKLIDFGISKLFDAQSPDVTNTFVRGAVSPGFTAPEQYSGGTDPRSDIYSLGATLYALLTRTCPPSAVERAAEIVTLVPLHTLRPDVPVAVCDGIEKLMKVRPGERPQSMREVRTLLGLDGSPPTPAAYYPGSQQTMKVQWPPEDGEPVLLTPLVRQTARVDRPEEVPAPPPPLPVPRVSNAAAPLPDLAAAPPPWEEEVPALTTAPLPASTTGMSPAHVLGAFPRGLASAILVVFVGVAVLLFWQSSHVAPPASVPPPAVPRSLQLTVSPVGTALSVDGRPAGVSGKGPLQLSLGDGSHELHFTHPGFLAESRSVSNQTSLSVTLHVAAVAVNPHHVKPAPHHARPPAVTAPAVPAPPGVSPGLLSIGFALVATTLFSLGIGVQKGGVQVWADGVAAAWDRSRRSQLRQWTMGACIILMALAVQVPALRLGTATTVAMVGAFGVVVLVLFSALIGHEPVGPWEALGMAVTVAGVALGSYAQLALPVSHSIRWSSLLGGAGLFMLGAGLPAAWSYHRRRAAGLWLGVVAGFLAGFTVITLRLCFLIGQPIGAGAASVVLVLVSALLYQLAYQRGRAVEVLPGFTAAAILGPVVLGPVGLGEPVRALTGVGILLLLVGVVMIGISQVAAENARQWGVVHTPMELAAVPSDLE